MAVERHVICKVNDIPDGEGKSFNFNEAQLMTIVTLDVMSNNVLKVAIGTLSFEPQYPKSPSGAAILKNT